jgi:hypothetical protein
MSCAHRRVFEGGYSKAAGRNINYCGDCGATFWEQPDASAYTALVGMLHAGLGRYAPMTKSKLEGATLWAGYMIAATIINVHRKKGDPLMCSDGIERIERDVYLTSEEAAAHMDQWAKEISR